MKFSPNLILKRANNLEVKLNRVRDIDIIVNGNTYKTSNYTLPVLDAFAYPIAVKDALNILSAKGQQDWIALTQTIHNFFNLGILVTGEGEVVTPPTNNGNFNAAAIHIAMLNDKYRTDAFIAAINKTVKEGDVVVDIGTGTGVMAIAAARAGAKKVYAIEGGVEIGNVAQAVISATEVADKITLIRGQSTAIDLPEKGDVLISETIGNDPFDEGILNTYFDACKRLLKPGAALIPSTLSVLALPVYINDKLLDLNLLKDSYLEDWKNWYGTDFSALEQIINKKPFKLQGVSRKKAASFKVAGPPIVLANAELNSHNLFNKDSLVNINYNEFFNGLVIYFDAGMQGEVLTSHPTLSGDTNHWLNPLWYFPNAENFINKTGGVLQIKYSADPKTNIQLVDKDELQQDQ